MKRRTFLYTGIGAVGALVVGWAALPPRQRLQADFKGAAGEVPINGWVRIDGDGMAVVAMPRSEMGQGISTAVALIAAEELDLPLARVRLEQAPQNAIYLNSMVVVDGLSPYRYDDDGSAANSARWFAAKLAREVGVNLTGGSSSVKDLWQPLREAAAQARASIVQACARANGTSAALCRTDQGQVILPSGAAIAYGEVIRRAGPGGIALARAYRLRPISQFRLIGRDTPRLDARAKSSGQSRFGIDVRLPGMRYAALSMAPSAGARLLGFEAPPGLQVLRVPAGYGQDEALAVVADHWWQAHQGAAALTVRWDESAAAGLSAAAVLAVMTVALDGADGDVHSAAGDFAAVQAGGARALTAQYSAPFLAHQTMEPMNCTAQVAAGAVKIWAPTQAPDYAVAAAARVAGVAAEAVELTITQIGGGFGRRLEVDFIAQATAIALQTGGVPIQLIWTREQDSKHDFYRPAAVCRLTAMLGAGGEVLGLSSRSVSGTASLDYLGRVAPGGLRPLTDPTTVEGLDTSPYVIANQHHVHVPLAAALPIGSWRSVGHSMNAFFIESFVDELAAATGRDPVAMRRVMLKDRPRHLRVLELAVAQSGWTAQRQASLKAQGRALGVALHESFTTICAQIAEVSVHEGRPTVHRVVAVVDMGLVVNPDGARQQVEGAIIMALSAALHGEIGIEAGRVLAQSFGDQPLVGMADAPTVDVHFIPSSAHPRGIGESGVPPLAPAVANALFNLTGQRLRSLPLRLARLEQAISGI